jgi:hypothetical protein
VGTGGHIGQVVARWTPTLSVGARCSSTFQAIKKGVAEGEAIATGKLFAMVKAGNLGAVIFYLKAKCGWRDWPDPAGVSVNIGMTDEERQAAEARQREMFKLLTPDEMRMYRELLQRLAVRQQQRELAKKGAIETTATPVASNGSNGPKPDEDESNGTD